MKCTSSMRCPPFAGAIVAVVLVAGSAGSPEAWGRDLGGDPQAVRPSDGQPPAAGEDLRRLIEQQQRLIQQQADRLDALERDLKETRRQVATLTQQPSAVIPEVEQPVVAVEHSPQRQLGLPADVSAELPGAIPIPGTNSLIRIQGQARMTLVNTLAPLGTDDRFVTSSIPVGAERPPGDASRLVFAPIASRFGFDVRTPFRTNTLRTFIEGDFAGTARAYRLRHAYAQTNSLLIGQTWSTFSDPEAEPIGVDFEGLNAISLFRQPQLRYTRRLRQKFDLALALENPAPDLSGVEGVNQTPDLIARVRWEPGRGLLGVLHRAEHVQVAILARQLRGEVAESLDTVSTGAVGANVSGVMAPRWDADDRIKFAGNAGWGIGKYISDLGTLGGQDGVYDPETGELEALQVDSAYLGYERVWKPNLLSAFTYGIVHVHNRPSQAGTALSRTQRFTVNLTWLPVPQADLSVEFLGGSRLNKDGQTATSTQIQFGWTYRF